MSFSKAGDIVIALELIIRSALFLRVKLKPFVCVILSAERFIPPPAAELKVTPCASSIVFKLTDDSPDVLVLVNEDELIVRILLVPKISDPKETKAVDPVSNFTFSLTVIVSV